MIGFYDLRIWQEVKDVLNDVLGYECLDNDRYVDLQLRRAANTVGLNISQGKG